MSRNRFENRVALFITGTTLVVDGGAAAHTGPPNIPAALAATY